MRARARPVKVTRYSPELAVHVRQTVAFRAECECGWRGPSRSTMRDAHADAAEHTEHWESEPAPSPYPGYVDPSRSDIPY